MTPEQQTLISEAADEWTGRHIRRYTDRTQEQYRFVIGRFVESLPEEVKTVDQLERRHIEAYIDSLLDKNYAARSCNGHLSVIKSFCRWLYEPSESPNPAAKIKWLREQPPKQRVLSDEEYQKVLDVCTNSEADVIRMLANTGLRAAEMQSLTWGCISLDYKMIVITGKGGKRRHIPTNTICREILSKYERELGRSLQLLKNMRYRNALYKLCQRLGRRAGIPKFGAHAFRHRFATELLRRGTPIAYVSKILGHHSIRVTEQLYIHFAPEFLNGATECLCE